MPLNEYLSCLVRTGLLPDLSVRFSDGAVQIRRFDNVRASDAAFIDCSVQAFKAPDAPGSIPSQVILEILHKDIVLSSHTISSRGMVYFIEKLTNHEPDINDDLLSAFFLSAKG